jgi:ankyrin repeat protein
MGSLLKRSSSDSGGSLPNEIQAGNVSRVKSIIEKHPEQVNLRDDKQDTPLHIASRADNREILEMLISAGADTNAQNNFGYTPLHIAAISGQKEAVALLLAAGADVAARDRFNRTSQDYAEKKGSEDIVNILSMYGAKEEEETT